MDKQLKEAERQLQILKTTDKPIVIWGTLTAGKMALEICRNLGLEVNAFGDNNMQKHGKVLQGIKIISVDELKTDYFDAVIMLGSFNRNVEHTIIKQLEKECQGIIIIPCKWIEYFYEVLVIKRRISDKNRFWESQNNIFNNTGWRYDINRKIISEFRYKITNHEIKDLEETISSVYGIRNLYLIIKTEEITDKILEKVEKIASVGSVGHLILVTDGKESIKDDIGKRIQNLFFYAKVQTGCKVEFLKKLQNAKILYELDDFPKNIFHGTGIKKRDVTEQFVYDTVQLYVKGETDGKKVDCNKKVIIVQLFNGLANQMLIYLFGKFLERCSNKIVIFDDTVLSMDILDKEANVKRISKWCPNTTIRKVEDIVNETRRRNSFYCFSRAEVAEVFQLPIRLLSDYFDVDIWKKYLRKVKVELIEEYAQSFPLGQVLLKFGVDITVMQDYQMPLNFLDVTNCFYYDTHILEWPFDDISVTNFIVSYKNTAYFMGVWTMGKIKDWLFNNRDYVKKTFQFHVPTDKENKKYIDLIYESEAVMIHVRRGDFVQLQSVVSGQYVKDSIYEIMKLDKTDKIKFFLFSDDLDWCKQNMEELGLDEYRDKTIFVEGNTAKNSYLDMYLMSLGKVLVPSPNSTFSYMALLLSSRIEKCVDALQYEYFYRQGVIGKVELVAIDSV